HLLPLCRHCPPHPLRRRSSLNAPAANEIYTLSLHDALPICTSTAPRSRDWSTARPRWSRRACPRSRAARSTSAAAARPTSTPPRSEEHTSELQSRENLVCRLLLEKKKDDRFISILYEHEANG